MTPIRHRLASAFLATLMIAGMGPSFRAADPARTADPRPAAGEQDAGSRRGRLPSWAVERDVDVPSARPFKPFAIRLPDKSAPSGAPLVRSHTEYDPMAGVLYRYAKNDWSELVAELVAALTGDPDHDEIAYVVVGKESDRSDAENKFDRAGADLSKVQFLTLPTDSIWIRDYGPQFVWRDDSLAILDTVYFTTRPKDNFTPTLIADDWFEMPRRHNGLYVFGGDFFPGPARQGFVTSLVNVWNAAYPADLLAEVYRDEQGIDTLHVFPRLPSSVDLTQHLDMWLHVADEDTAVISQFIPGSNADAITVTDDAAAYMEGLGFEVIRVPDSNGPNPDDPNAHFTYANAFRVNDRIFIPGYGSGGSAHRTRDAQALAAWQQAAPNAEIVQIDAWDIVGYAGSVACIVMPVPRRVLPAPTVELIAPTGGEWWLPGESHEVRWGATDDVEVVSVDLLYSTDDGATWGGTIVLDETPDGRFTWQTPQVSSETVRVKAIVRDGEGLVAEAISSAPFTIRPATRRTDDFASGAGVDKQAWGHKVTSWNNVGGFLPPNGVDVDILDIDAGAYASLASSDDDRYASPTPESGFRSAHHYRFTVTEDPARIRDVEILWEGYGDSTVQMELYVWDHTTGEWCDGRGGCGENRFIDNFGGSRDEAMGGHIRADFERFLDASGRLDLLVYAERSTRRTFHDYVALSVISVADADLDGVSDDEDCAPEDGAVWSVPAEVDGLTLSHSGGMGGTTSLQWLPATDPGATPASWDLLRATGSVDFGGASANCVVSGGTDTLAADTGAPASDVVEYYLVRPANACGPGSLGSAADGSPRAAVDCP